MASEAWRHRDVLLLMLTVVVSTGCVTTRPPAARERDLSYTPTVSSSLEQSERQQASDPFSSPPFSGQDKPGRRRKVLRGVASDFATAAQPSGDAATPGATQGEAWEQLLGVAGLEERDERPPPGGPLTPKQAERLLRVLLGRPVTQGTFPARMAVGHLLRQVLEQGEVSREELLRRVARFSRVAVLRPDGYLAWVRDGRTQQKAFGGVVQWRDGAFRAGPFELGRFYVSNGFVFRLADEQLQPLHGPVLVEVYDDADYLSRSLDGAEAAFIKLALALGEFFTHPVDSVAALRHLPAGVAALLASSPEYLERFRYMTRGEQVQVVAELATALLVTKGTATSATRTMTGTLGRAEATVPVLALSADGALVLKRVAVPVGQAATVVGGGPDAALLLHRANTTAGASPAGGRGPGQWGPSEEKGMSERARAYQEQISGHSVEDAYWVGGVGRQSGGVKFDGFKDGVLLEAKGPGYAEFFEGLQPKPWFDHSGGADDLIKQARRQSEMVRGSGIAIQWHVAEKRAADAIRKLLSDARVTGVEVIHTPAL
ncbi:MAG TPA: Tox-REase-5 domain-containing protein [Myxococcaceae bacterium]|jgi:hypothetical protein